MQETLIHCFPFRPAFLREEKEALEILAYYHRIPALNYCVRCHSQNLEARPIISYRLTVFLASIPSPSSSPDLCLLVLVPVSVTYSYSTSAGLCLRLPIYDFIGTILRERRLSEPACLIIIVIIIVLGSVSVYFHISHATVFHSYAALSPLGLI